MDSTDLTQLRQAVQTAPHDAGACLALLHALIAAAAWQEAAEVGAALGDGVAASAPVQTLLGFVAGQQQQWPTAIACYQQALALQPDDAMLQFNLGVALAQHNDLAAAQTHLARAVALQEDWAAAHYNLGTVLLRQTQYGEAISALKRAAELRETYPEAHFNRGNAHAMRGLTAEGRLDYYELDCAITAYKTAIQQRPGYTAALYNLGMLYGRMKTSEGLRVWEQYLEATQDRPEEDVWRMRAQEYKRDLEDRIA